MGSFTPLVFSIFGGIGGAASPAVEEVVDMRGGWADPDLFL